MNFFSSKSGHLNNSKNCKVFFHFPHLANSSDAAQLLLELMSGAMDVTQNYLADGMVNKELFNCVYKNQNTLLKKEGMKLGVHEKDIYRK